MKKLILLLIPLLVFSYAVSAQDSVRFLYPGITKGFIVSCFTDTRDIALSPIHWKGRQWAGFGVMAASGLLLYTQEEKIRDFAISHQSKGADNTVKFGLEPWGSGIYSLPFLGGMYLVGRMSKNERASATALTAVKAAGITYLFVGIAKQAAHRHRPGQDIPAQHDKWEGPLSDFHFTSFPSGHSAVAFSIATVIATEYRETNWVPILAYSLASATAISRVYNDKHWASDVLVGSVVGYAAGKFLWKHNQKVKLIPTMSNDIKAMTLIYSI